MRPARCVSHGFELLRSDAGGPPVADVVEQCLADGHQFAAAGGDPHSFAACVARVPGAFAGAAGLYRSLRSEGEELRGLAARKLAMPVLAVAGFSGDFTPATLRQVATDVTAVRIDGIGHHVAMEAPDRLATTLHSFYADIDPE